MKTATVYIWDKSQYDSECRWHKFATYSKSVAIEVVYDNGILRDLNVTAICATDDETGEVIAEVTRDVNC